MKLLQYFRIVMELTPALIGQLPQSADHHATQILRNPTTPLSKNNAVLFFIIELIRVPTIFPSTRRRLQFVRPAC